ncbi:hypothetical protein [Endozoicomonas sp. ONNA2]|nr:hypothetical protein [Endozoicomonas sp. ONNA2]
MDSGDQLPDMLAKEFTEHFKGRFPMPCEAVTISDQVDILL